MGDIVSYLGSSVAMDAQSQEWYTVVIYAVKEKMRHSILLCSMLVRIPITYLKP